MIPGRPLFAIPTRSRDALVASALGAWSFSHRLWSKYTGSLIMVRRSNDNAESGVTARNGKLDVAGLLAFCGSGSGYITTVYDQSGNARPLTQTDPAKQPRIVNAGTLEAVGSIPCAYFPTPGPYYMLRPDACGLSGSPAWSIGAVWQPQNDSGNYFTLGTSGTSRLMYRGATAAGNYTTQVYANQSTGGWASYAITPTVLRAEVATHPAGTDPSGTIVRVNDVDLALVGSNPGGFNIDNGQFTLGARYDGAANHYQGWMSTLILFGSVLAAQPRHQLNDWMNEIRKSA